MKCCISCTGKCFRNPAGESKTIVFKQCPLKLKRLLSLILTISTNLQNKINNESIFVIMTTYHLDMREKPSSKMSSVSDIVHAASDF